MFSKWLWMAFASITFQGSEGLRGSGLPVEIPHLGKKKATTWLPTEEPAAGVSLGLSPAVAPGSSPRVGRVGWGWGS